MGIEFCSYADTLGAFRTLGPLVAASLAALAPIAAVGIALAAHRNLNRAQVHAPLAGVVAEPNAEQPVALLKPLRAVFAVDLHAVHKGVQLAPRQDAAWPARARPACERGADARARCSATRAGAGARARASSATRGGRVEGAGARSLGLFAAFHRLLAARHVVRVAREEVTVVIVAVLDLLRLGQVEPRLKRQVLAPLGPKEETNEIGKHKLHRLRC